MIPIVRKEIVFTSKCNLDCSYCYESNKKIYDMGRIDILKLVENIDSLENYLIGGESMLHLDFITALIDELQNKKMNEQQKERLIDSCRLTITNGTLVKKNIDIIKKYNLRLSISIDGPSHIQNINRPYKNGSGSYDDVIEAIELCIENNIRWSIHSTLVPCNYKYFSDVFRFYWEIANKKTKKIDEEIEFMCSNLFQIVSSVDINDSEINEFLSEQIKVFDFILSLNLSKEQEKKLIHKWFMFIKIGSCNAGCQLIASDKNNNISPCGEVLEFNNGVINFKLFNNYIKLKNDGIVNSSNIDITNDTKFYYTLWCPSANLLSTDSVFYQNSKFNLMIAEYNRFVEELISYYEGI